MDIIFISAYTVLAHPHPPLLPSPLPYHSNIYIIITRIAYSLYIPDAIHACKTPYYNLLLPCHIPVIGCYYYVNV